MPWFRPAPLIGERLPSQVLTMRRRDRLPTFAVVVENEDGTAVDLTGYTAVMSLRSATVATGPVAEEVTSLPLTVEAGTTGLLSYDWQYAETDAVAAGVYDVTIQLDDGSGEVITAPTRDLATVIKFRPAATGDYLARDEQGAFIVDGNGYATASA